MTKYKFRAKSLKTGDWVTGDLVYVHTVNEKVKVKPMIVEMRCHGGMMWVYDNSLIDESTIELIKTE